MINKILKRLICSLLITAAVISGLTVFPKETKAVDANGNVLILMVGNSYTLYNDLDELLEKVCKKNKWNVDVTSHAYNDMELAYMGSLPKVQAEIKSGNFEYVILQENSHDILENTKDTIATVKALMKMAPSNTMFFLYETMSYNGEKDRQKEYTAAYAKVAAATGAVVIPAGQKFWEYADAHPNVQMFADYQHPSKAGSEVVAQCIYDTLMSFENYNKEVAFTETKFSMYATNTHQMIVNATQEVPAAEPAADARTAANDTGTAQETAADVQNESEPVVLTYSSSDPKIAEIDQNGLVTGKSYGTAVVYAKDAAGHTARCVVNVGFSDIIEGVTSAAVYKTVIWGTENDIIKGMNGGASFGPDKSCTRAQFVTFLWRLAGRPGNGSLEREFSDVDKSASSYKAIKWAVSSGVIVGYDDGTFRPQNTVTRRQVATMLWRWHGRPEVDLSESRFSDMSPDDSSYRAVLWGEESGVMKGSNGRFNPSEDCLRRQIVTFLYRYVRAYIDPSLA